MMIPIGRKGQRRLPTRICAFTLALAAVAATAAVALATSLDGKLSWTAQAPLPTARGGLASATEDGQIFVLGGLTSGEATTLNTVQAYNPQTKHWRTLAPMPTARGFLGAASVDGQIYAIGGSNNAGNGSRIATWTFTGLAAGTYQVSATWVAAGNRATNAPFTVLQGSTVLGVLGGMYPSVLAARMMPMDAIRRG